MSSREKDPIGFDAAQVAEGDGWHVVLVSDDADGRERYTTYQKAVSEDDIGEVRDEAMRQAFALEARLRQGKLPVDWDRWGDMATLRRRSRMMAKVSR